MCVYVCVVCHGSVTHCSVCVVCAHMYLSSYRSLLQAHKSLMHAYNSLCTPIQISLYISYARIVHRELLREWFLELYTELCVQF